MTVESQVLIMVVGSLPLVLILILCSWNSFFCCCCFFFIDFKKCNNGKVSCSSFHHWVYESVNLKATLLLPIKSIGSMKSKQVTKHLDKTGYSYRLFSTLLPILCTYMMHFPWWEDIYVKNVNQLSKSQRDEQILVHENLLRLWDSTRLKEKSI